MDRVKAGHRSAHPLPIRIMHWIGAAAVMCMCLSGWAIYNASPSLPFTFPRGLTLGGWLAAGIAWHISVMWVLFADGARLYRVRYRIETFLARPAPDRTTRRAARSFGCPPLPAYASPWSLQCRAAPALHRGDPLPLPCRTHWALDLEAGATRLADPALWRISAGTQHPSRHDVLHCGFSRCASRARRRLPAHTSFDGYEHRHA